VIIFKKKHVTLINTGLKTVTRRKGKRRWKEGAVHQCYTELPLSGGKPFARVRIERVYEQELGAMTEADASKEGGYTLSEFRQLWRDINGAWRPSENVWVVEFRKEPRA
jgi:hypothetical protein